MRIRMDTLHERLFLRHRAKVRKLAKKIIWRKKFAIIPCKVGDDDWRMFEVLYRRLWVREPGEMMHLQQLLHDRGLTIKEALDTIENSRGLHHIIKQKKMARWGTDIVMVYKTPNDLMTEEL